MFHSLTTVLAVCVVLWAAVTTSDEAVSVLAVVVGVLVLLRLGDLRRIERLEDRFDALIQRLREARASGLERGTGHRQRSLAGFEEGNRG